MLDGGIGAFTCYILQLDLGSLQNRALLSSGSEILLVK